MTMRYRIFEPTAEQIEDLLAHAPLGRLVTLGVDGPEVGLLPYVWRNGHIEIHLNSRDPQLESLARNSRCSFQVDDPLTPVPSTWVDADDARFADLLYRAVTITGNARTGGTKDDLVRHLEALLNKQQPNSTHLRLATNPQLYDSTIERITLIRIPDQQRVAKFRLSQQEPEPTRRIIVERLRERGSDRDLHTATLIESTLR